MGLLMIMIGATGFYASGKTDLGHYLESKGFVFVSLSDVIRNDLRSRGVDVTRENLIMRGNELRATRGHGVLAEMLLSEIDPSKNYFVDSIRHQDEVKVLRRVPCFELWNISAPIEVRFARLAARNREQDPKTIEELRAHEQRESAPIGSPNLQVDKTQLLADRVIENAGKITDFFSRVDELVEELALRQQTIAKSEKNILAENQ